jgi:hypothetical protein
MPGAAVGDAETHHFSKSGFITCIMLRDKTKKQKGKIVLPHCPLNPIYGRLRRLKHPENGGATTSLNLFSQILVTAFVQLTQWLRSI